MLPLSVRKSSSRAENDAEMVFKDTKEKRGHEFQYFDIIVHGRRLLSRHAIENKRASDLHSAEQLL